MINITPDKNFEISLILYVPNIQYFVIKMKKNIGFTFLMITTIILLLVVCLSTLNKSFHWIFYLTVIGQIFLVITVYKVLTDSYSTDKTFEDFYEDHPIDRD